MPIPAIPLIQSNRPTRLAPRLRPPALASALFCLALCLTLPRLCFAADQQSLQNITLQLRWLHQFQFAGYYAAKQQGYYREIGLDVEIRAGAPGREPVKEVMAGRAQYGAANSELLHQRLNGAPLIALAAIFQHSGAVFVVKQSSGIRTPQHLIGRKVMLISKGADVGLMAMLNNEGVDISKVEIIKSSYDITDLIEDRVDAFNAYLTNEPYLMAEKQIPVSLIHPSTYGVDFYSDILFTTETELAQNPERVKQFRQASLRGWEYAMDNPEQIIELILNQYTQAKSREQLRFEAASIRDLIMPDLIEYGHMNPGRWRYMAETFVKQGMIPPGYNLDGFLYDPNPVPDYSRWYVLVLLLLLGLFFIGAIAMTLLRYNRKLKNAIAHGQQVQGQLQQQTTLFEAIFRSTPDATVITNTKREIILCNPAFSQTFGYPPEEVISQSTALLYANKAEFTQPREGGLYPHSEPTIESYEIDYRRKNGEIFPSQSLGGPIINTRGHMVGYIEVMRDITAQKKTQLEMVRLALTDPLTGLANRHQFNRRFNESVKLAKRQQQLLSLAIMDLDLFKPVNDQFGHPTGDELLKKVAQILTASFRETDIIARIGGDEFAIIMIDPENPRAICQPAERVIEALSQPLNIAGSAIQIGSSFGIATFPLDSNNPTDLYRLADQALYRSKAAGKNCCSIVEHDS
ncbi:MAG: ABC transporter substrate-binding protein [Motiliproteus sp.]